MRTLLSLTSLSTAFAVAALLASVPHARAADDTYQAALQKTCPVMAAWQKANPNPINTPSEMDDSKGASDKALLSKLIALYTADEKAGEAWAGQINRRHPDAKVREKLDAVRSHNLKAIKTIVAKYGFPTTKMVGVGGVWAAFMLVQHADKDHAFQRSVLHQLEKVEKQNPRVLPGEPYAYLVDRVMVAEGRKQIYGTQLHLVENDLVIRPVENASRLEARRERIGLFSMKAYMCYVHFRSGKQVRFSE